MHRTVNRKINFRASILKGYDRYSSSTVPGKLGTTKNSLGPMQYLENIRPTIKHSDWLILLLALSTVQMDLKVATKD